MYAFGYRERRTARCDSRLERVSGRSRPDDRVRNALCTYIHTCASVLRRCKRVREADSRPDYAIVNSVFEDGDFLCPAGRIAKEVGAHPYSLIRERLFSSGCFGILSQRAFSPTFGWILTFFYYFLFRIEVRVHRFSTLTQSSANGIFDIVEAGRTAYFSKFMWSWTFFRSVST